MTATSADHARVLLGLAGDHELAARSLLGVEGVTDAGVGFHAGQAVERSLKAVLGFRGVEYPFTHSLGVLLACCEQHQIGTPPQLAGVDDLSLFADRPNRDIPTRARLDRDQGMRSAACAVAWARALVG
jgi:hypothetical protein